MTYLVEQGMGYTIEGSRGLEHHQTETYSYGWCCDSGCGARYLTALAVPDSARGAFQAGQWLNTGGAADEHGNYPLISWGEYPCADSPSHEYCPACGRLTIHGSEDGNEDPDRACDGSEDACTWTDWAEPDPVMCTTAR